MTALELLRSAGPMPALDLALALGLNPPHLVYVELVAAESAGDAFTYPQWSNGKPGPHIWEAM